MADKWPLANGNWSNAANWNGGTLPAIGDDVYADGRTITLDVSIDIGTGTLRTSQRSGGTAGGSFITSPGITITANVAAGTAAGISHSSGFVTINGNIARGTAANSHGVYSNSSAGMQINGNTNGNSTGNGGDIYCANGTTTITGNIVSNGSSGAALWIQGGNATINGNITSSGVNAVWMIAGGLTVNGNVTGNSGAGAITNYSSGNPITINGNLSGNIAYSASAFAGSAVVINGNITAGGSNANCVNIATLSTPSLVVTGNVSGGSLTSSVGIGIGVSIGNVTINGNVTGGSGTSAYGVAMTANLPTVTINGDVTGGTGSGAFGLYNNTLGTARVLGTAIGNNHGLGGSGNSTPAVFGYGISSGTAQATTSVRRLQYGPKGQSPTAGLVQLDVTDLSLCSVKMRGIPPTFTEYTLATAENLGSLPSDSDVRLGTVFNFGNRTGTCAVPPAASVAIGVPVDNTVGTAAITAASISSALADEFASVLSAIGNIEVDNAAIAQAVRSELGLTGSLDSAFNEVIDTLDSINIGNGPRTVTITVNDGTTNLTGAVVTATRGGVTYYQTTISGVVTFYLTDGDWTITVGCEGYSSSGGTLTVNGTEAQTYSLSPVSISASSPGKTTGYWTCFDEDGNPEEGASVSIAVAETASTVSGNSYDSKTRTELSAANGVVQFTNMHKGVTYRIQRGTNGPTYLVTVPLTASGSVALDSFIGLDDA